MGESLASHLMETPENGRIKLYLTARLLNFRREQATLFRKRDYVLLDVKGEKMHHVIAFSRTKEHQHLIVAVGRFYTQLSDQENVAFPLGEVWKDTRLLLPTELQGTYRDLLSGLCF